MLFSALPCLALSLGLGATRPTPTAIYADSENVKAPAPILLTVAALQDMTAFWTSFLKEPSSVRDKGGDRNERPLSLSVPVRKNGTIGEWKISEWRVIDMGAMATEFPSVAADLANVHLTAQKWEQYSQSLFTAWAADQIDQAAPPGALNSAAAHSVVWQNVAFLRAHQEELKALKAAGISFPSGRLPRALLAVDQSAPQFTAQQWINDTRGAGSRTTFGDGHIYVLDFTAPWCMGCPSTYPDVGRLSQEYKPKGVRVMFVATLYGYYGSSLVAPAEELDSLKHYVVKHRLKAPMLVAEDGQVFTNYVQVYPQMFVIDGAGTVRYRGLGWSDGAEKILADLVASSPQKTP